MSMREPRTQIHSGIHLIRPYCKEKEPRNTHYCTEMYFTFHKGCLPLNDTNHFICADLQCVRPVAGGPMGETQCGDGVASVDLWLWHEPGPPWWCRQWWWWLSPNWGDLITHWRKLIYQALTHVQLFILRHLADGRLDQLKITFDFKAFLTKPENEAECGNGKNKWVKVCSYNGYFIVGSFLLVEIKEPLWIVEHFVWPSELLKSKLGFVPFLLIQTVEQVHICPPIFFYSFINPLMNRRFSVSLI